MKARTRRDLTIVRDTSERCLVIACDSCGGIGVKDGDVFKLPPEIAAQFTARVALTEVMCSGALPVTLSNGVSCEMLPTGEATIRGIRAELELAGLTDVVLTGSTEENFPTSMTALAVTVVGTAGSDELKFGSASPGDILVLLGRPRVGAEVNLRSPGFYAEIRQLLQIPGVREIVPVGSKGVRHEAEALAELNSLTFSAFETDVDYAKSAGPATCLLVLCAPSDAGQAADIYPDSTAVGMLA